MSLASQCKRPNDAAGKGLKPVEVFLPYLEGRAGNEYSQFGEDGLIEAVFEVIGTTNRWCFEVGAADGVFYSNTKRLRDGGWSAVLIESDESKVETLRAYASPAVRTIHATVSETMPIDGILAECRAPRDLDLGVIDIDGQDYWAWLDMQLCTPRVMLVEFDGDPCRNQAFMVKRGGAGQTPLKGIQELGEAKGYILMATTAVNALFVKSELLT